MPSTPRNPTAGQAIPESLGVDAIARVGSQKYEDETVGSEWLCLCSAGLRDQTVAQPENASDSLLTVTTNTSIDTRSCGKASAPERNIECYEFIRRLP